ncbi:hypothetical protein ACLIBH_06805 [Virgibacillus sp. W0430]|uniref:hypothetical protein n=1 Tax=Virgibacillus sp. W0430 TaxID=3391580 RepID=UPI003F45C46E
MNRKQIDEQVIQAYEEDERMMILIYAQWCVNNELDPRLVYEQAYPEQRKNTALEDAMALTVPKDESENIDIQTVLHVLQTFGNESLAFAVQEAIEKRKN